VHDSNLLNKADPRVPTGTSNTHSTGTHGSTGFGNTHGSDNSGPHDSRLANKADPRVDSDQYGAAGNAPSAGGYGHSTGVTGSHNTHSTGLTGGSHGTHSTGIGSNTYGSDQTGPHDSYTANKLDPRVDSDRYGAAGNAPSAGGYGHSGTGLTGGSHTTGSHTTGTGIAGNTHSGTTGYGSTTGTGSHGAHGTGHLPGPAPNTAGAHGSDMLNKLDPRIDSDLDGSKKVGGDRTFG